MTDYETIKVIRSDMTDWILHLTKSFSLLEQILQDSYLKPAFAPRTALGQEKESPTVRGPDPAVCFTEMPLWAAKELTGATMFSQRYFPYGVAFQKSALFDLGGRPVIYADGKVLGAEVTSGPSFIPNRRTYTGGLPIDMQYLWVGLDLGSTPPKDWTHEREWRCKVDKTFATNVGLPGVPLNLGNWKLGKPTFKVVVKTLQEEQQIRTLVQHLSSAVPTNVDPAYYANYTASLKQFGVDVAVLDAVQGVGHKTARIETYF